MRTSCIQQSLANRIPRGVLEPPPEVVDFQQFISRVLTKSTADSIILDVDSDGLETGFCAAETVRR